MEIDKGDNKTADLSDYLKSDKPARTVVYAPLGQADKKKKIYILIIIICMSLSAVFWGMYFNQTGGGASQNMDPSQTLESFIPGPAD